MRRTSADAAHRHRGGDVGGCGRPEALVQAKVYSLPVPRPSGLSAPPTSAPPQSAALMPRRPLPRSRRRRSEPGIRPAAGPCPAGHRRGRRQRRRPVGGHPRPQHPSADRQRQQPDHRHRVGGQAVHRRRSAAARSRGQDARCPPTTARRSTSCCAPPTTARPRGSGAGRRSRHHHRVAARYGLASTTPPSDGRWWNTMSTVTDLIRYYDMLLDGSGACPPIRPSIIVNDLAQSTPNGLDGYPQRFGIPDGLYAEPVAVKQGWMCCIGSRLDASVDRRDRGRSPLHHGGRVDAAHRRRHRPRHHHPGGRDDFPGRAPGAPARALTSRIVVRLKPMARLLLGPRRGPHRRRAQADGPSPPRSASRTASSSGSSSSGRRSRVRCSEISRRQAAIRAWSPDSSTSGTSRPRQLGGRV